MVQMTKVNCVNVHVPLQVMCRVTQAAQEKEGDGKIQEASSRGQVLQREKAVAQTTEWW